MLPKTASERLELLEKAEVRFDAAWQTGDHEVSASRAIESIAASLLVIAHTLSETLGKRDDG